MTTTLDELNDDEPGNEETDNTHGGRRTLNVASPSC
jgi:hypothetical protein